MMRSSKLSKNSSRPSRDQIGFDPALVEICHFPPVKGDSFLPGKPRLWSQLQIFNNGFVHMDAAPDGKRFAVFQAPETAESKGTVHVTVLLNFFDELRRRVPRN